LVIIKVIKQVYSANEVAEILGIGKSLTYRMLKNNEIHSIRTGNMYKIPIVRFNRYLEESKKGY